MINLHDYRAKSYCVMVGCLFVVVLFGAVGLSIGHKHSTALDSFRYDRATVQLGKYNSYYYYYLNKVSLS